MYLDIFKSEIESILDDTFREFVVDALSEIEEDYFSQEAVREIKATIKYLGKLLEVLDAEDMTKDMFIVIGLIYLHCKFDNENDPLHMLRIRSSLASLQSILGRDMYENIMYVVEGQEGYRSPIPQIAPRPEATAYEWILPFSIALAKGELENGTVTI